MTIADVLIQKHLRRAKRYEKQGDPARALLHRHQAIACVLRDLEHDRDNAELHRLLGDLHFALEHWVQASEAYAETRRCTSRLPLRLYHNWAEALLRQGQGHRCLGILKRLLRRATPHYRTYCLLGEVYKRHRDWIQAHEAYEMAIALKPKLPAAVYQGWYQTLAKVHSPDTHAHHVREKLAHYEESPELNLWLAKIHSRQKEWAAAILHYERLAQQQPDMIRVESFHLLCQALRKDQRHRDSALWAQRGLTFYPQNGRLHFVVAQQHLRDRQWELARHHYQLAVHHDRLLLARVHRPLGQVLQEQGHLTKPLALWGEPYSFQAKNFHPQPPRASVSFP